MTARFLCVAILLASGATVHAEELARGPYLQNISSDAATLRWRTDVASDSRVWIGARPDSLSVAATAGDRGRNHELRITGLEPGTRYYYAIGSGAAQLASGADYFFETAPASAEPTRIWVLGDSGTGTPEQREVRDAYYAHAGAGETDLVLMLGDNAYERGTDSEHQARLFDVYDRILRHTALWPTFGNHEGYTASSEPQTGPYYEVFSLPREGEAGGVASGTEAYYSFDYGNIHFVCLNSYDVSRAPDGPMLTWLRRDLAANDRDWTIAYFHHPPYSKGSHDSDLNLLMTEMRTNALPILEQYGVDLVLAGHSHSYERSMLIDGHYGRSGGLRPRMILDDGSGREGERGAYDKPAPGPVPHAGTVYAVVGVSGEAKDADLDHPVMYTSRSILGSMVIDIDGNRLDATQLDNTGATVDSFTIVKGADQASNSAPPAPRDPGIGPRP
ncbi:MAG TPA: metallophosphoesterase family protein [Steroidobacteraceae bacterium]|nr:metallophosphoesterase family protein [Steroidobacteraceae bacterium]